MAPRTREKGTEFEVMAYDTARQAQTKQDRRQIRKAEVQRSQPKLRRRDQVCDHDQRGEGQDPGSNLTADHVDKVAKRRAAQERRDLPSTPAEPGGRAPAGGCIGHGPDGKSSDSE